MKKILLLFLLLIVFFTETSLQASEQNKLANDSVQINEVTVFGSKRNSPLSVTVIDAKTIEKNLESSVLPTLTEEVPGLFITQRGVMGYGVSAGAAGGMSIRGIGASPTTGVLILINGHPQYMGLMGHPLADSYQSSMIERIEVTRGAASMMYGSNAIGGTINIITKKQNRDGVQTNSQMIYGSYNTFSGNINTGLKKGKWNSNVDLQYNRTDGHRENMNFEQYGGYGKVGYDFSKNWKTYVDFNISKTFSSNPGTISVPFFDNDADILRGMTSVIFENNYDKTSGGITLFGNFGKHIINDGFKTGGTPPAYRFNSQDQMFGGILQQSYQHFKGNTITFGVDFTRTGGKAWNKYPDKEIEIIAVYLNNIAGYVNVQQNLLENKLKLSAGIRYDSNQKTGNEWIPQVGINYQPSKTTVLKAIASKGFRNPTIREMYMFPPQNPDLQPEKLMNYELSASHYLLQNKLNIGLNIFLIEGDNMIQTAIVNGKPLNVNSGKIKNSGFEIISSYKINGKIQLSANYSFLNMKNKILATPEHKLYVSGNYSFSKWKFSTGIQYINGLYTAVGQNPQKENYTLWDTQVSYKVAKLCTMFIKGENLLNDNYQIIAGYPMPSTTLFGGLNFHI